MTPTAIVIAIGIMMVLMWFVRRRLDLNDRDFVFQTIRGFAREIIRDAENNPRTVPRETRRSREEQLLSFSDLSERTRPRPIQPRTTLALIRKGREGDPDVPLPGHEPRSLLEFNEDFANTFWSKAQGIRNGCLILIMLLEDKNPVGARNLLRRHLSEKRSQAFQAMRDVLMLDTELTLRRERSLRKISTDQVLAGLDYRPFDEERVYVETEILKGLRNFVR